MIESRIITGNESVCKISELKLVGKVAKNCLQVLTLRQVKLNERD